VWVPERHFHPFGGLYPNPSVVASALSMVTRKVRLRAGSVVLPLHHPARVAEEWAVVDNLSGGRVDLAFTPGWSVNDFALAPERYATRQDSMFESVRTFQALWRGETSSFTNGAGEQVDLSVFPRPRHADRPLWLTCTRGRDRFEKAGELGANVLTALLMQTTDELADNIAAYRASRARHGFDPDAGVVTLMLHTYIGEDLTTVRELVREPLHQYLVSSIQLWGMTEGSLEQLSHAERSRVIETALERYIRTSSLIGTVETAKATVQHLQRVGVNEMACLIDFGVDDARTLEGLGAIACLRDHCRSERVASAPTHTTVHESYPAADPAEADEPLPFF
jgi:natural product biosynthesis luciferase-like monooxygenase protein